MKVLYATDGSVPARNGELLIKTLFDRSSTIHTFSVAADLEPTAASDNYEMLRMDVPPINAEQVAAEAADRLGEAGFSTSSSGVKGHPASEILRVIESDGYDLVVLGASHTTWMGNILLGSVSTHVLHHAPCSVMTVHRAPIGDGVVLLGIDGSGGAIAASELAMAVLDRSRCSIVVAGVVTQPWFALAPQPTASELGSNTTEHDMQQTRIDEAWDRVEGARSSLERQGFETEGSVLLGPIGSQLLKEADNVHADLVVVGSRGLGPLQRTLLGSVSDQVARHAPATLVGRVRGK